ncbi:uncharacterized protein LOC141632500 [Silene latifolia]|uniref:uncharacterized protein LOC141632500 n=1 Tax=Silene latifolia TaxID=37657 RepID=UPI003D776E14
MARIAKRSLRICVRFNFRSKSRVLLLSRFSNSSITMSATADSIPSSSNNQYDDPTFVSNFDYAGMQLVNPLFNGKNFLPWSRSVLMALSTKNKQGFLTGTVPQPAFTSSPFSRWLRADSMVRCWLLNSMIPTIKEGYLSCKYAKLLWKDKKILDASIKEKVPTFLMGLNDVYDSLRTNIMATDPILPINKTYSIVQQIESQKLISKVIVSSQDASALNASKYASKQQPWNVWKIGEPKGDSNKKAKVDDSCFIKYPELKEKFLARLAEKFSGNVTSGQPEGQHSGYYAQRQYQGQGPPTTMQFDPEILGALYHHMMQMQQAKQDNPLDSSDESVNFAGITLAFNVQSHGYCNDWIIDSSASDHMSANKCCFFADLRVLSNLILIGLLEGSTQLVTHGDDIHLKSGLTLYYTLFVPVFKHNLLSVGKLLSTTSLLIRVSVDKCIIQDSASECPLAIGFQDKGL